MSWLSDTWREITSGGKAQTKTYNGSKSKSSSGSSSSRPANRQQAPSWRQAAGHYNQQGGSGGGGGGGGGRLAAAPLAPVSAPQSEGGTRQARGGEFGRESAPQVRQPVREPREPQGRTGADVAREMQPLQVRADQERRETGRSLSGAEVAEMQQPVARRLEPPSPRETEAKVRAEAREPRPVVRSNVRELTDQEFAALSPRQRAAVLYNTGLVNAANTDRREGTGTEATRSYLTSLDLAPEGELDAFLRLDRAIGDNVLARLDDPTSVRQSTEARRWARGVPGAAPQSQAFADARSNADRAASAMSAALSRGYSGISTPGSSSVADALAGGGAADRAGFGTAARDQVIQRAFDVMIGEGAQFTPEQVANGIANMNDEAGTDVTPQEVWDFARLRLDAADYAALAGEDFVLPVTDATIVPLSIADIRRRYGI